FERRTAMVGEAAADRHHFTVGGRIVVGPYEIAPARKDLPVADDHRAERPGGLLRFIERQAHKALILGRGIGRARATGAQHGGGAECDPDAAPAVQQRAALGSTMFVRTGHRWSPPAPLAALVWLQYQVHCC